MKKKIEILVDSAKEKEVIWFPDKLRLEIKNNWPEQVQKDVGYELGKVQIGLMPSHSREMPSIGLGVREIKVQDQDRSQYRLIYIAKFAEGIYVFHVITKKTSQKTERTDIEISKARYRDIIETRKQRQTK